MKLNAGLITPLPASDSGSATVWGSKKINPRPQSCLCLTWSGYPSNDNDCIIHQQVLATKTLPKPLKEVLDRVIKAINVIKSRPLATWLFKVLHEDLGSMHEALLFHTEVSGS